MKIKRQIRRFWRRSGRKLPENWLDEDTAQMRRMAQELGPDDVVIDLGAHVGNASIEFAHCAKHVYAFEPNPRNFKELKAQTRRYSNISVFEEAVSDKQGEAKLFYENAKLGRHFEGATILSGKSNIGYDKSYNVKTVSILDVLDRIGEPVSLIKMDVEGAEYVILDALITSGRLAEIGKIYVECHADRIEGLQDAKDRTLAAAEAKGWLSKLDFTWP
ncbi:MAG: FkbM family methyltransferase [Paracoccaceae bacterium]|nr:FkbM family methyltransferase [Paracoccaceae bacterium]